MRFSLWALQLGHPISVLSLTRYKLGSLLCVLILSYTSLIALMTENNYLCGYLLLKVSPWIGNEFCKDRLVMFFFLFPQHLAQFLTQSRQPINQLDEWMNKLIYLAQPTSGVLFNIANITPSLSWPPTSMTAEVYT